MYSIEAILGYSLLKACVLYDPLMNWIFSCVYSLLWLKGGGHLPLPQLVIKLSFSCKLFSA